MYFHPILEPRLTTSLPSSSYAASSLPPLLSKNITSVLTIMGRNLSDSTLEQYREHGISQRFIKRHDVEDENMLEVFGELCEVIEEKLRQQGDGCILVHCAMGVSRSVSVVLAYGESSPVQSSLT